MRRAIVACVVVVALVAAGTAALVLGGVFDDEYVLVEPTPTPIRARTTADHLRALQRIADRSGGIRAAGTAGDERTTDYIERTLRAAGWSVRVDPFRFTYWEELAPARLSEMRLKRDFRAATYSGSGRVRGRVRRVRGLGCYPRDYAGLRRGEIAVAQRGMCRFTDKARVAARVGAGALLADDVYGRTPVAATLLNPGKIPVLVVTHRAAQRLEGRTVSVSVSAKLERRETANVIAQTRPRRDGRWVMAGAHHDSVAAGPGINDDGSGIAALLTIAQRRRTPGLRFGFWAAEELGLFGSKRFVRSLDARARDAIEAYVNFDMLGSPNALVKVYDRDDDLERAVRAAIPGPEREASLLDASDHAPFEDAGIPIGGIFTGASERGRRPGPADDCYHRSCDTLRHMDVDLARRMTEAADRVLLALAR